MSEGEILLQFFKSLMTLPTTTSLEQFWRQALPALMALVEAQGAMVIIPGVITAESGEIAPEAKDYLAEWKREYREGLTANQRHHWLESGLMLIREAGNYVFAHLPISKDNLSAGVVTFIFPSENASPEIAPSEQQLLAYFFDVVLTRYQLQLTQQRINQVEKLYEVAQHIAFSLDLSQVLQETTDLTCQVLDAEAAALMLVDFQTQELIFEIPTGEKKAQLRQSRMPMSRGVAGYVARTGEAVIVNDVRHDFRFNAHVDEKTGFVTRSILCVPLQIRGQTIGVLEVLNKKSPDGFTQEDLRWLENLAPQVAIAVENARLYESVRQENKQVISIHEEVRHQLARDLHDGPAQDLSAIIMGIQYARRLLQKAPEQIPDALNEIESLARQANLNIRQLLFELRPIVLETRGLVAAIQSYVIQVTKGEANAPAYHLSVMSNEIDLEPEMSGMIFSIVQEALNNVRKHARAENVWIRIFSDEKSWVVEVEDDGVGFDVSSVLDHCEERNSLGLLNMQERARYVGGVLQVVSPVEEATKKGTLARLTISKAYLHVQQFKPLLEHQQRNGAEALMTKS